MKTTFRISVEKPCSEKFENFEKTEKGGFCSSCEKEVIGFTKMSQTELIDYICTNPTSVCGRFKNKQEDNTLNAIVMDTNANILTIGIGAMAFSLLTLCTFSSMTAQETAGIHSVQKTEIGTVENDKLAGNTFQQSYTIIGKVVDEDNLPLGGVNVVLKGTAEGITTDFDGKFEFPKSLEVGDVLVFSYLGYDTKTYEVKANPSEIVEIEIVFNDADIELMGAVVVDGVYETKRSIFQKFIALFKK